MPQESRLPELAGKNETMNEQWTIFFFLQPWFSCKIGFDFQCTLHTHTQLRSGCIFCFEISLFWSSNSDTSHLHENQGRTGHYVNTYRAKKEDLTQFRFEGKLRSKIGGRRIFFWKNGFKILCFLQYNWFYFYELGAILWEQ